MERDKAVRKMVSYVKMCARAMDLPFVLVGRGARLQSMKL